MKFWKGSIEELKEIVSSNTKHRESLYDKIINPVFDSCTTCNICHYEASLITVLKSHMTRKHKHEVLREDIETPSENNISVEHEEGDT